MNFLERSFFDLISYILSDPLNFILIGIAIGIGITIIHLYFQGAVCKIQQDLTGKVVIVTGSNTGIGYETALSLAQQNAKIILACRDEKRAQAAKSKIEMISGNTNIEFIQLDLSSISSTEKFAEEFQQKFNQLDILINNAGQAVNNFALTKDGVETTFETNHLGHFHLTNLLLDVLKSTQNSRIVVVSALAHQFQGPINWDTAYPNVKENYNFIRSYCHSKLANIYHAMVLQQNFNKQKLDIKIISLHPGVVRTEFERFKNDFNFFIRLLLQLGRPIFLFFSKSSSQGAQTSLYCALVDFDQLIGGEFYSDCKVQPRKPFAKDFDSAQQLWELSEKLIEKIKKKKD